MARHLTVGLIAAASLGAAAPAEAASLIVAGGELIGATGVDVDGSLYDVEFVEGSCADLFNGCASGADLQFTTYSSAAQAAQALLDQVFVDGGLGQFDSDFSLTFGCEPNLIFGNFGGCAAMIPYQANLGAFTSADAFNYAGSDPDVISTTGASPAFESTTANFLVFARFRSSIAGAVPEPSTWATMLLGFGLAGGAMRAAKRRQKLTVRYA